ncbi:MAG TPA: amino acid permease [Steroidobacteraceae bacterium]|nr:amino acid permease [Steroidobacteraceae bacterium]
MQQQGGKELGFWMCTALVVGNTIGVGIYVLPASLAPYGFNALIGWGVTVVGMTFLARVFAQLARQFPTADGPQVYIERTSGSLAAFVSIWCYWISVFVTNAALAIGIVGYLGNVVPALQGVSPALLAVLLIWLFVGVNVLGVRTGGAVQVVTTVLKLLPMLVLIVLGVWLLVSEPATYVRHPPSTPITLTGLMAASTIALFAMLGIESAAVPAGRVRDPARTIPRSTLFGTLLTAAIYIVVSTMALLLMPQDRLAQSSAPFAELLGDLMGGDSGRWLSVFVVVSGLGALNGWTLIVGELTASLGRHGYLPATFARANRFGAPAAGLVLTALLATPMVLMNYSRSLVDGFTFLTQVVTAANLPLYFFCALALVVLTRRGERGLPSSVFVLGLLGTAYSVFAFVGVGREPFFWAIALGATALPVYWYARRRRPALA